MSSALALGPAAWHARGVSAVEKFTEEARLRFLEGIRLYGRFEMAANKAGCTPNTVRNWMLRYPDAAKEFKAAWELAKILHGQEIVKQLEDEALHGHVEPIFDKDGNRVGERRKYETPLRAMMMKRYDADYREKTEVTHKAETGVMVVPTPVTSVAAWAELVQNAKSEAEAKAKEVEKGKES